MVHNRLLALTVMLGIALLGRTQAQTTQSVIKPGERWLDNHGEVINAHGGGLLFANDTYYWFGEKRGRVASEGVNVYASKDLIHWKNEGLALAQSQEPASDITIGCLMERPKVIYNPQTKQYVMWFHLELAGKGYDAARAGVAVSATPTGPYQFVSSFRPNGNMSRDMTLFVDEDGSAYQMYSSRDNYDLRVVKLTDDYLTATTQDSLLFSSHREAPALFKRNNRYYLITSGCTGWDPNEASVHEASSIFGPWKLLGDPMQGPSAKTTFGGQSTYVQPIHGKPDAFLFMADRWNPKDLKDSRYLWLPVFFEKDQPIIRWTDQWNLNAGIKGK